MNKELKVVLKTDGNYALYLYVEDLADVHQLAKFVVATVKSSTERSGQIVDSWYSGHYFFSLEEAEKYYDKLTQ